MLLKRGRGGSIIRICIYIECILIDMHQCPEFNNIEKKFRSIMTWHLYNLFLNCPRFFMTLCSVRVFFSCIQYIEKGEHFISIEACCCCCCYVQLTLKNGWFKGVGLIKKKVFILFVYLLFVKKRKKKRERNK